MQNDPRNQLRSVFQKTAYKNKLKPLKIESHELSRFLVIEKTVTGVWGWVREYVLFIFIIIFICTHKFPI